MVPDSWLRMSIPSVPFPHEGDVLPPSPSSSPPSVECIGMLNLTGDSCLVKASITWMLWLCYEVGIEEAMIELGT